MTVGMLMRGACLGGVVVATAVDIARARVGDARAWARIWVATMAVLAIAFTVWLWTNHVPFPLHLDLMEGTVLQHAVRAASGQAVYPEPTAGFVALAYNPLYYFVAAPAIWLFGPSLAVLRIVAIVGFAGAGLVIFAAVRRQTKSAWWGLIAAGTFAAAYHVMDSYLDTAHSDSWLLFSALLGTYVIDRAQTRGVRVLGVLILALSFWFKQHGALFAIAGVLYLTWRSGLRAAVPYWIVAVVVGPVAYLAAVSWPFGPAFHYFTWTVPSGWSRLDSHTVARLVSYFGTWYPFAGLCAVGTLVVDAMRPRERISIWDVMFVAGVMSAAMGALDWGSADNVFIPCGTFTIVLATIGLARLASQPTRGTLGQTLSPIGVGLVLLPLLYDPRRAIVAGSGARAAYADLLSTVRGIGAPVYAPDLGQVAGPPLFSPSAHWVALEDMGRGPGHDQADRTRAWNLLAPVAHPTGPAFLLTNIPIERETPPVSLLARYYVLDRDFGDRFSSLAGTPKRFEHGFPRYLYHFVPPASDTDWVVPR